MTHLTIKSAIIACVIMYAVPLFAQELGLPFPGGETWILTRGYNTAPTHVLHSSGADDRYALDFTLSGCQAWDRPMVAMQSGVVRINSSGGSYGNNLAVIESNGCEIMYAHLNRITVSNGARIEQGAISGTVGNTGRVEGASCPEHPGTHLHVRRYCNGVAVPFTNVSGVNQWVVGSVYTSNNTSHSATHLCESAIDPPTTANNWRAGYTVARGTPATGSVNITGIGPATFDRPVFRPGESVSILGRFENVNSAPYGHALIAVAEQNGRRLMLEHNPGPWGSYYYGTAYFWPRIASLGFQGNFWETVTVKVCLDFLESPRAGLMSVSECWNGTGNPPRVETRFYVVPTGTVLTPSTYMVVNGNVVLASAQASVPPLSPLTTTTRPNPHTSNTNAAAGGGLVETPSPPPSCTFADWQCGDWLPVACSPLSTFQ